MARQGLAEPLSAGSWDDDRHIIAENSGRIAAHEMRSTEVLA